jgi:hypothetical protein
MKKIYSKNYRDTVPLSRGAMLLHRAHNVNVTVQNVAAHNIKTTNQLT